MRRRRAALAAMLAQHGEALLTYARLLTGDDALARVLVETAVARAYGGTKGPRTPEDGHAASVTHLRRAATRMRRPAQIDAPQPDGAPWIGTVEALRHALGRLPVCDRALLVMRHVDGLTPDQIAMVVGGSPAAISASLAMTSARLTSEVPEIGLELEQARWDGTLAEWTSVVVEPTP